MKKTLLLIILMFSACGVKQPVEITKESASGQIYVTSGDMSGTIYLDGKSTTRATPDTLFNVPVGVHVVQVVKDGYRSIPDSQSVLVEENTLAFARFDLKKLVHIGKVFVTSIPERGEIFVDDQITGKFTPDTLQLETGLHRVAIRKNGYQPREWSIDVIRDSLQQLNALLEINHRVLLESFANVSCAPCVDAARNLHDFVTSANSEQFAIIDYFANWPNPNDPFYNVSPGDVDQRLAYYSISALPALIIDGSRNIDATYYPEIVNTFSNALANHQNTIGLSIERKFVDGFLTVDVEIYYFELPADNDQLRLFVAIIENDIHFNSAPGSNGLTDFSFVFRTFLSSSSGDSIQGGAQTKTLTYRWEWSDWNYSNCQVIAFVQNISTDQIVQTTIK